MAQIRSLGICSASALSKSLMGKQRAGRVWQDVALQDMVQLTCVPLQPLPALLRYTQHKQQPKKQKKPNKMKAISHGQNLLLAITGDALKAAGIAGRQGPVQPALRVHLLPQAHQRRRLPAGQVPYNSTMLGSAEAGNAC